MRRIAASSSPGSQRGRCCIATPRSAGRSSMPACRRNGRSPTRNDARAKSSAHSVRMRRGFSLKCTATSRTAGRPGLTGIERLRFTVNCLTRLRFVDRKGRLMFSHKGTIADAPRGAMPWFRHPERATREDALVFGHWSALGYLAEPGLRCLDTGCVWGGSLTALRLDRPEEPVRLACRAGRRISRLITCSVPGRRRPTRCRSVPRIANRSGCRRAGAECS